ncbi:MAG: acyltransferase [bacterium]
MVKRFFSWYFRKTGNDYYNLMPWRSIFLCWLVQRIFLINSEVPLLVHYTSHISGFKNIKLGKDVKVSLLVSGCVNIGAANGTRLTIGDNTIFARNICIRTANHGMFERKSYTLADVEIGKNCWLGHGCVILPGVKLGDNVTVGANSVVTKTFPSNVVIAGNPAKIIKDITANEEENTDSNLY